MESFIRTRRKQLGLTVPEIARKLGVSDTAAWKWDRGKSLPRDEYVEQLAPLLKVSVLNLRERLVRVEPDTAGSHSPVDRILERARDDLASSLGIDAERIELKLSIKMADQSSVE